MTKIDYPSFSAYAETPQLSWRMGRYVPRVVPASRNDTLIEFLDPKYANRPDRLSDDLYGTPAYWWVFQARNPNAIRDPIWDMAAGMRLIAPGPDALLSLGLNHAG